MDDQQRIQILTAAGYAFGAAGVVAPGMLAKAFGMSAVSGELKLIVRGMSVRNVALAEALRTVGGDEKLRKRFYTVAAAMFAADAVGAVLGGATGKIPWRAALPEAVLTGALGALAGTGAAG